jgi:hypothetical protein
MVSSLAVTVDPARALPTGVKLTACVAQVLADHFHARR